MQQQAIPAPTESARPARRLASQDRIKWLFLLPAVVWVLAFTVFPLAYALRTSFYRFGAGGIRLDFIGLDNFQRMLTSDVLHSGLRVTLIFVVSAVTIEMVLGVALALFFNREIRGRQFLRTAMTLPLFATPVAVGYLAITMYYEENGPINGLITTLGGSAVPWLSHPTWAKVAVIIVDVWQWTPFVFLIALAGLQGLPHEVLEAAEVDGSSRWQVFRYVTLPLLAPILWLILLLRTIDAFKVFDIVASLTLGGPGRATEVYTYFTYRTARRSFDYGGAAAQGFILLFIVMLLVTLLWTRIRRIYDTDTEAEARR